MERQQTTNRILTTNTGRGMSLIEVVVWIGVVTLLMASMTISIIQVYKSNSYTLQRVVGVISARRGMENVSVLIRQATYSDVGAYPIVSFGDNTMSFYVDEDGDSSAELVRIFLEGEDLNIGVIEPAGSPITYDGTESVSTIVSNIRNVALNRELFTYYNSSGAEVTDQSAVLEPVYVDIDLVANTGKNPTVNDYELKGSAFMRNLKN